MYVSLRGSGYTCGPNRERRIDAGIEKLGLHQGVKLISASLMKKTDISGQDRYSSSPHTQSIGENRLLIRFKGSGSKPKDL